MKKYIITAFLILGTSVLMAQNMNDAMRYSQEELNGTARYKAMSGAFGALGGDLSATAQNPAGSSVFNVGQVGVSLGSLRLDNKNTFSGNTEDIENSDFSMAQLGTVFVFKNYTPESNWNKFTLGFNYQKTNSFEGNNLAYSGYNKEQSVTDFFGFYAAGFMRSDLETKNGESVADAYRDIGINGGYAMQQAFLGYQGYLLEPETADADETNYFSRAKIPADGVRQAYNLERYGDARKFTFNFSTEYGKTIYLGLNLNSHVVDYRSVNHIVEDKYNLDSDVQYVNFSNELYTSGGGFSLQLGAIVKATKDFRLGVAYQSPTWYTLQDETRQILKTDFYENSGSKNVSSVDIMPNVTNIYQKYTLKTPSKWTASVAYLFGKRGLLSFDYIYKGYESAKFSTENGNNFNDINRDISNAFANTNSFRVGGEFRATPQFSIRAGYRFEQSPYKDKKTLGDLNGYSFGLGYDFGAITLDASYDITKRLSQYQMFDAGLTSRANIDAGTGNFLMTLSLKL